MEDGVRESLPRTCSGQDCWLAVQRVQTEKGTRTGSLTLTIKERERGGERENEGDPRRDGGESLEASVE